MPFSSGSYSLPSGNPVVTGTTISSSTTNTTNSDIATALSSCILKDGTQTVTANIPMASHKITGLSAGTTAGDSVEYGGSPSFTNLAYTGTLTGSTGILNIGSGQLYKDASGNVGIGTSSPAGKLDVRGAAYFGTPNTFIIGDDGGSLGAFFNETAAVPIRFLTAGSERMRIASSGIITMAAYGAGAATFSASGVISSVSDETWKIKDGAPNNPDEMLQKLKPGYWFYNEEKAPIFGTDRQLGFYAQNVNEAIGIEAAPAPEEGKPWGYYDRSVLAVTVMSLQKALTTIEALTARLTLLEAK